MSSLTRIGAFSLVLLLVAGCTIGEDYVRPEVRQSGDLAG